MNFLLKMLGLYIVGEYLYTRNTKEQGASFANSIQGNKLDIGASGALTPPINLNSGERCDICPDSSRGILYCNLKGPMPYYADKQFEVIFASHVTEHIEPEYVRGALEEMSRIGKQVVIVLPHPALQGFYTGQHPSLIYKIDYPCHGLYVRNNPLRNGNSYEETILLDHNIFRVYQ